MKCNRSISTAITKKWKEIAFHPFFDLSKNDVGNSMGIPLKNCFFSLPLEMKMNFIQILVSFSFFIQTNIEFLNLRSNI